MSKPVEEIRQFIVNSYLFGQSGATITDGQSFLEAGIIDSTGILELVQFLEEKYGIKVQDDELVPDNLDSVNNIIRYLDKKLPAVGRSGA